MTKKDYVAISRIIKQAKIEHPSIESYDAIKQIQNQIAEHLAEDNPNFDYDMFYAACSN